MRNQQRLQLLARIKHTASKICKLGRRKLASVVIYCKKTNVRTVTTPESSLTLMARKEDALDCSSMLKDYLSAFQRISSARVSRRDGILST